MPRSRTSFQTPDGHIAHTTKGGQNQRVRDSFTMSLPAFRQPRVHRVSSCRRLLAPRWSHHIHRFLRRCVSVFQPFTGRSRDGTCPCFRHLLLRTLSLAEFLGSNRGLAVRGAGLLPGFWRCTTCHQPAHSHHGMSFLIPLRPETPNQALLRTQPSRHCCNPSVPWAGSLSMGR